MISEPQTGYVERVAWYGDSTLLTGVLTTPIRRSPDKPAAVILNAGVLEKSGANRLGTNAARMLASQGIESLRFDFAGVGDSPNRDDGLSLADGVLQDVKESLDYLERISGQQRFVLFGLCSGADSALRAARADERVVGIFMIDPTIDRTARWYAVRYLEAISKAKFWIDLCTFRRARMRRRSRRERPEPSSSGAKPEMFQIALTARRAIESCLRELTTRGVEICFVFTGGWREVYNYSNQLYEVYPRLRADKRVALRYLPKAQHTFDDDQQQQDLFECLGDWCRAV